MEDSKEAAAQNITNSSSGESSLKSLGESSTPGTSLKDSVRDVELTMIEEKKKILEEIEKRVDSKTKQLREAISEFESHGRGFAGIVKKEPNPREYSEKIMRGELP